MFKENEIKITDAVAFTPTQDKLQHGNFQETITPDKLMELMGWNEIPKLANKSYTYDMRKILGQLTAQELKNAGKREAKELKVKRGKAKIRKLLERIQ